MIKQIGKDFASLYESTIIADDFLNQASMRHKNILKVLNVVGGFHLEGLHLKNEEQELFDEITTLVKTGQNEQAEEISTKIPFEQGLNELESISEVMAREE